jgi:hypothetical protein
MLKRRLKEPFGKAGLMVAIAALIFALAGGAYAANNLGAAASKAKAGPRGKTGKTGPAGPQGPAGPKGDPGVAGANGTNGAPGANGKSVTVSEIEPGDAGECEETGGALVAQEGASAGVEVCTGEEGPEGSPWTVGGTLPKGKTETGVWAFGATTKQSAQASASFNIPLAASVLPVPEVVGEGELPTTNCPGEVADPKAKEGFFCVYVGELLEGTNVTPGGFGQNTSGFILRFFNVEASLEEGGNGTWAVTAK